MAVFEVTKPALCGAIHISDDYLQTLPISAFGHGSNRSFQLLQTLPARPSLPALEVVSQKYASLRRSCIRLQVGERFPEEDFHLSDYSRFQAHHPALSRSVL